MLGAIARFIPAHWQRGWRRMKYSTMARDAMSSLPQPAFSVTPSVFGIITLTYNL